MNYEQLVQQFLAEAYFSSPYEKSTGIKRQRVESSMSMDQFKDIEQQYTVDPTTSAHKQTQDRISGVIERAAQETAEVFQMAIDSGFVAKNTDREVAKRLAIQAFRSADEDIPDDLVVTPDPDSKRGLKVDHEGTVDNWSLPHFRKLLKRVGELTTGKGPMSPERVRNIILQTVNEIKKTLAEREAASTRDKQPVEEPQPTGMPQPSDYAMQLMRKAGRA